jgi:hypothetical protein
MRRFEPDPAPSLSAGDVTAACRSALAEPSAVPGSWTLEEIHPSPRTRVTAGVFRCQGEARVHGEPRAWSAVLKVLRLMPWQPTEEDLQDQLDDGGDEPGDVAYWLREAKVYTEDLLPPGGCLRAPALLATARPAPARYWLWLEDVRGEPASAWDGRRWTAAAEHLGQFQGYFAARPAKPRKWFAPSFLATAAPERRLRLLEVLDNPATWDNPVINAVFRREEVEIARQLSKRRAELTRRVMAEPHTLCHRDLSPDNLFAGGNGGTVAIDWTLAGLGPVGEDLANMFSLSATQVADECTPADYADGLIDAYLRGLGAVGRIEGADRIRDTFRLISALQLGVLIGLLATDLLDPQWCARKERERGVPVEQVAAERFALMAYALRQAAPLLDPTP